MDTERSWRRLTSARSAVLGTRDRDRGIHLVPVVYTPLGESRIVVAVDGKPKRSRRLRRLDNIQRDPRVTLLVEHYEADWSMLWWVRVDGLALVHESVEPDVERRHRDRYPQLDGHMLGPWIDITVEATTGWSAS